jgi:peroxisomal enoyl-CoA hydratase 2
MITYRSFIRTSKCFQPTPSFSVSPHSIHPSKALLPADNLTAFKGTATDVIDFYAAQAATPIPDVPKFDSRRVVDGQRYIEFLKPLPSSSSGKSFQLKSKVLGVYDKGKAGSVVETQQDLVSDGTTYARMISNSFFIGQGNWGGPKGPATVNYPPPEGKRPDATQRLQLTPEAAHLYRLNGDYNPLHADPEPGKKMGFGGTIMHGLFSWNWTAHALLQELGASDPKNIKDFQARFASPVKPGDTLVAEIWRTGEKNGDWEEVRFVTKVEGGKVVLSNGRASMKCSTGQSKL